MTEETKPWQQINRCNVCMEQSLEEVISLPKFPFTGIYCSSDSKLLHESNLQNFIYTGIDQGLMLCSNCSHAQLKSVISPKLVYDSTYTHRGSTSPIATQGNQFFAKFISSLFPNKTFHSIVDIGCNDGFLLQQLENKAEKLVGIDPIWIGKNYQPSPKISILGGFIESVDLGDTLKQDSCLVVSAHAFEHMPNPRHVLETIVSQARPDTIFAIEIPSFDTLIRNHRFDQIFHQHIQYFSQYSFMKLIQELKCSYLSHTFNYSMWGGTMLFAFKKTPPSAQSIPFNKITKGKVLESYKGFQRSLNELAVMVANNNETFYGFGAAQMVPSLVYHIPNQLKEVEQILDDNTSKHGLKYPQLHFNISSSKNICLEDVNVIITALDSTRPILERLIRLKAKRIFIPTRVI